MNNRENKNLELIQNALAAEITGKSPRLFASRKTIFGIPSALDYELEKITSGNTSENSTTSIKSSDSKDTKNISPHHVIHPLPPVYDNNSRVLILGTMPSPKSRETGFYYNHPQNRFWKVMAHLFDTPLPESNEEKQQLILDHKIALWDVLAECTIEGAKDATIAECIPNNISAITSNAPIRAIFCTGNKAAELFTKYCEKDAGICAIKLPSTSAANAATSLESLIVAYKQILEFIR